MKTQTAATVNGIDTDALRAGIDAVAQDPAQGIAAFRVTTHWTGGFRTATRVEEWSLAGQARPRGFDIHTDEPAELAGRGLAANPQEVLQAALNACMTVGYIAQCALRGIEVRALRIDTRGELDLRGFFGLDDAVRPGYPELAYTVHIDADATDEQLREIHQAVIATSPNRDNLARAIPLRADLVIERGD